MGWLTIYSCDFHTLLCVRRPASFELALLHVAGPAPPPQPCLTIIIRHFEVFSAALHSPGRIEAPVSVWLPAPGGGSCDRFGGHAFSALAKKRLEAVGLFLVAHVHRITTGGFPIAAFSKKRLGAAVRGCENTETRNPSL